MCGLFDVVKHSTSIPASPLLFASRVAPRRCAHNGARSCSALWRCPGWTAACLVRRRCAHDTMRQTPADGGIKAQDLFAAAATCRGRRTTTSRATRSPFGGGNAGFDSDAIDEGLSRYDSQSTLMNPHRSSTTVAVSRLCLFFRTAVRNVVAERKLVASP